MAGVLALRQHQFFYIGFSDAQNLRVDVFKFSTVLVRIDECGRDDRSCIKQIVGYKVFRIIYYFPAIISGVAMVAVYTAFINTNGPLGSILSAIGIEMRPEGLLHNSDTATPTIMAYCIWTGFTTNVLLFCGAFARIPVELIESARLVSRGREFLRQAVRFSCSIPKTDTRQ